jgi:anaerobic selenocysteine-containing dehydrogenase
VSAVTGSNGHRTRNGHRRAFRTCPLCEATCGLALEVDGERVVSIRGDAQDVFSHGFICPKGTALRQLHDDPTASARP